MPLHAGKLPFSGGLHLFERSNFPDELIARHGRTFVGQGNPQIAQKPEGRPLGRADDLHVLFAVGRVIK
jgi:hypothetical protein